MPSRRVNKVDRINLSDYSLKINTNRTNKELFNFSEIEDFVMAISGDRKYQYDAIKEVMSYLWGGGYKNVTDLAKRNFKDSDKLRQKYASEEMLLNHIPLADRHSGVVHMATGTGKSWAIFAIAYLSIIMGYVDRVLVLGPSSTVIEKSLNDKFAEFMRNQVYMQALPPKYRGKPVEILNDTDHITDGSIVIENINAIYREGGIIDSLKSSDSTWLVLSDEVHHAYSHLKFEQNRLILDQDVTYKAKKQSDEDRERLWMKFLREYQQIKWHIGFTGTPYNSDDFFADVIYNYSLRTAIADKYIKDINPLIKSSSDEGDPVQWTDEKRYTAIMETHLKNIKEYSYPDSSGKPRVKPITIFICNNTTNAKNQSEAYIKYLAKRYKNENPALGEIEAENNAREQVICVTSKENVAEYKDKLENIEELDPSKVGGTVEFIFAVNKLSEGWDVDNVFQIVPMQDKIFNSKLLISQVLGRGLRKPRNDAIPAAAFETKYPVVTIQNHEKFSEHIKEVLNAVIQSDMYLAIEPLPMNHGFDRAELHYSLFNYNYLAGRKIVEKKKDQKAPVNLVLEKFDSDEKIILEYVKGDNKINVVRKRLPLDLVVGEIHDRLERRAYEGVKFDFGFASGDRAPSEQEIRQVITDAMNEANIEDDGYLHEDNRKQIELYFNQFLPRGNKKPVSKLEDGNVFSINTAKLPRNTVKLSDLDRDHSVLYSEDYKEEVSNDTNEIIKHLIEERSKKIKNPGTQTTIFADPLKLIDSSGDSVRPLVDEDHRSPYLVNPSVLKSPQNGIIVSHTPEKVFVFKLIDNSQYLKSFIKSPDSSFYSISYEYWKGGKDRMVRSFNPDFFILIDLNDYISKVTKNGGSDVKAKQLQDKGYDYVIKVAEIKSDFDNDETIEPKRKAGISHFDDLNKKLLKTAEGDFETDTAKYIHAFYTFDLLRESDFNNFFFKISTGEL